MQVGSASISFASKIHLHALWGMHHANQSPFCNYLATADAGALRYMFHSLSRFFSHLRFFH